MGSEDIKQKIKNAPKSFWVLLLIIMLGIFLRTYHFRDLLVFNPDQARDAMLVRDVTEGKQPWLILGPEAGNTHFDLGPWFYHLEILSAKVFGFAPDKLAYPDLIFSILSIPLFYYFVRKYFSLNLSLALAFFYSISYFMVRYSRFAFNPNSIPFFVLLFLIGMLWIMEPKKRKGLWGAALVGMAFGVGMQLHILLLFILPTVSGFFFLVLFWKKTPFAYLAKCIAVIFIFAVIANAGQIAYEIRNGTYNTSLFFRSVSDSAGGNKFGKNLPRDLFCQSQANLQIISSLGNTEQCDFYDIWQKFWKMGSLFSKFKDNVSIALVTAGLVYSLGGYILLGYFWKKETDAAKKNFLALVGVYGLVTFLAMYPIITQASLRYYIVVSFLTFIFLGIWLKFILFGLRGKKGVAAAGILAAALVLFQFQKIDYVYGQFKNGAASDEHYAYLGETENMFSYIQRRSLPGEQVFVAGDRDYFSRFYKPLLYMGKMSNMDIQRGDVSNSEIPQNAHVFFVRESTSESKIKTKAFKGRTLKDFKDFGQVMIIDAGN